MAIRGTSKQKPDNDNLKKSIEKFGQTLVSRIIKELVAGNHKASGQLIRSLQQKDAVELVETIDGVLLNIKSNGVLKYIENGRTPGTMPNVDQIVKWVKFKGIKFEFKGKKLTDKQTGFVIAKNIQKKGISPTDVINKSLDIVNQFKKDLGRSAMKDIDTWLKGFFVDLSQ